LRALERPLGLSWPVSYEIREDENTCRIISDPAKASHEIWLHAKVSRDFQLFQPDVAHELCHAWLAENIDPCFSCMYFKREYTGLKGKQAAEFAERARMTYVAWCHVDIWVNEVRHHYRPKLTTSDLDSFSRSVLGLARRGQWQMLGELTNLLAIALNLAEIERFGLSSPDFSFVLKGVGEKAATLISVFQEFYVSLPQLSIGREKNIKILEESVVRSAQILDLPFIPRLVYQEDRYVWEV